jgi:hypothetical protein
MLSVSNIFPEDERLDFVLRCILRDGNVISYAEEVGATPSNVYVL